MIPALGLGCGGRECNYALLLKEIGRIAVLTMINGRASPISINTLTASLHHYLWPVFALGWSGCLDTASSQAQSMRHTILSNTLCIRHHLGEIISSENHIKTIKVTQNLGILDAWGLFSKKLCNFG